MWYQTGYAEESTCCHYCEKPISKDEIVLSATGAGKELMFCRDHASTALRKHLDHLKEVWEQAKKEGWVQGEIESLPQPQNVSTQIPSLKIDSLRKSLNKAVDSFGNLPVLIDDGKSVQEIGRISVIEVPGVGSSVVLRVGDTEDMVAFGKELREGQHS